MKIHFLGTCSGTEPMPDMHHVSLVIEVDGGLYWFDAGENCSHSAYLSGLDYSKVRSLFISHPHIDHVGGMANILFVFSKLRWREKLQIGENNTLNVYLPQREFFEAVKVVALSGNANGKFGYEINENLISDGVIFDDGKVKVSAIHNAHLGEDGSNGWHSYSFLIEAEGKRVVYSGDVKSITELDCFVGGGCDVLMMETGHHKVTDVCDYALEKKVKRLLFTHHGREILENRAGANEIIQQKGVNATICYDGMIEIVK